MNLCIFGAASDVIDKEYMDIVEDFALTLSKRGHNLVFGAGGQGLMGASARGFKKGGTKITGVIPSFFDDFDIEIIYRECDELIFTETMRERKGKMEDLADAFIVVPGGIGTFEEFFEVLTLKQLGRHSKPIAIYNINGYYDAIISLMEHATQQKFLKESCSEIYKITSDADELIAYVEETDTHDFEISDLK